MKKMLIKRFLNNLTIIRSYSLREIPTVHGLPIIGTFLDILLSGGAPKLHIYVDKRHKEYGPIYKEKMGPTQAIFIADPEIMRSVFAKEGKHPMHILPEAWIFYNQLYGCSRGLFFMNGEEWLHYRRIMNQFLLKGDLSYMENAIEKVAREFVRKLQCKNANLDLLMYRWSLDNILSILIGYDDLCLYYDRLDELAVVINKIFETSAKLQLIPAEVAARYNIKAWKEFVNSVNDALNHANHLLNELIKNHPQNVGLLGLMLTSGLTHQEICKIIVDLVLAAGDTTAYAMQWALYSLARHPNVQERLLNNCESFRNVIKETLRLYPVAPFLTRILPDACCIDQYRVDKNAVIIMSIYTTGRDDTIFKNADQFLPERWNCRTSAMLQASIPFAIGGRSCIGKKIAELQMEYTMKYINQTFFINLLNEDAVDVVLKMVAVPSRPIRLQFKKRDIKKKNNELL